MSKKNKTLDIAISSFLKKERRKRNITERDLATLLKISQQQISRYENGRTQITMGRINQYLEVFGLSWDIFIYELNKQIKKSQIISRDYDN